MIYLHLFNNFKIIIIIKFERKLFRFTWKF